MPTRRRPFPSLLLLLLAGLAFWQCKSGKADATGKPGVSRPQALPPWTEWRDPGTDRFSGFLQSVFENDIAAVKRALDSGMTVDWKTETGLTPVSLAVAAGYEKLALLLLQRGGRMDRNALLELAILNQSLALIKFVEAQDREYPLEISSLVFALQNGTSQEILGYLSEQIPKDHPTSHYPGIFHALAHSQAYATPGQKSALAHHLLDAGFLPRKEAWGESPGFYPPLALLFRKAKDSALPKRFPYWDGFHPSLEQDGLDKQLGSARSLEEVDSLLDLGANPLGLAAGCGQGEAGRLTGALRYRIRKSCRSDPTFSALDWRIAGRFLERLPEKVGPLLEKRDSLFIGVTTGQSALIKSLVESYRNGDSIVQARTPDGKSALAFAAEAGDSAMSAYLLKYSFDGKDKEAALQRAVLAGSPSVVNLLLDHGTDIGLPAHGGEGLAKLFDILFGYRSGFPTQNDTLIAKSLLGAFRRSSSSSLPPDYPLPLARYALRKGKHPVLLAFLLRQDPGPIDADSLFKGIQEGWEALGDTAVMNRVSAEGHEDRIIGAIHYSYYRCPPRKVIDAPQRVMAVLDRMNGFIGRGVLLGKHLGADWQETLGLYQVEFDRKSHRFVLAWRIPSLFSTKADFKANPIYGESGYKWVGD